jgi:alpha-tubulin suppressor-like RCC1 family protein
VKSLVLSVVVCASLLVACEQGASISSPCTRPSDCASPLVCRFGRCRVGCVDNRDCPLGAQCFLDPSGAGACQLDQDRSCGGGCPLGLSCLEETCVRVCTSAADCPSDGACALSSGATLGICTDPRSSDAGVPDGDAAQDAGDADLPDAASAQCDTLLEADEVCAGWELSCARAGGRVLCWGGTRSGELGRAPFGPSCDELGETCSTVPVPVLLDDQVTELSNATAIACGADFACALIAGGTVRCWGRNYSWQLGAGFDGSTGALEVQLAGAPLTGVSAITAGAEFVCALRGAHDVVCWGANEYGQLGRGSSSMGGLAPGAANVLNAESEPIVSVAAGAAFVCGVYDVGAGAELRCLGHDEGAQLGVELAGLDPLSFTLLTVPSSTLSDTAPVLAPGFSFVCAAGVDGLVRCHGRNDLSQLGRGSPTDHEATPALVSGLLATTPIDRLFSGADRETTCAAVGSDVYCWGGNLTGEAGAPPRDRIDTPTRVAGLANIVSGACGPGHCCAVDASGGVWCWGENRLGVLGRGALVPAADSVPARVCNEASP